MIARAAGDQALAKHAQAVAAKTSERYQFLIDVVGVDDAGAYFPHRVVNRRGTDAPMDVKQRTAAFPVGR